MLWQNSKGQIVNERNIRFWQSEFEVLFIQAVNFDLTPQLFDVLRVKRTITYYHVDGENDIVTGNRFPVMPDRIGSNGKVIDRPIGHHTPSFRKILLGQAMLIEAE